MMSAPSIAFVFPGKGSRKVGMLAAWHGRFEAVAATFNRACEAPGYEQRNLSHSGGQDAMDLTQTTPESATVIPGSVNMEIAE